MTAARQPLSRPYVVASVAIILLTLVATLVGLFVPGFYRDAPVLLPQVYGQDLLTLVVALPAFVVTAYFLWQRRAWGYAFMAVLLVKIATLGGAVLAMAYFMVRDGQPVPLPQILIFGVLTLLALVLMGRFVLAIDPNTRPETSTVGGSERGQ